MQRDFEEAEDLDFTEEQESWNVYKLSDGTTLKIRIVLQEVKRLKKWKPDGSPIYVIASTNIVRAVNIPEELKQTPKPSAYEPV
mgnify:CR=1 FL=1